MLARLPFAVGAARPLPEEPTPTPTTPPPPPPTPMPRLVPMPPTASTKREMGDMSHMGMPWVWTWQNGLGLVAVAANAISGAATGQSGTPILVSIAVLAARMSLADAAACAAAVSAMTALPSLYQAMTAPHPIYPGERPRPAYTFIALGIPALLVGVELGALLNRTAPAWFLALLLVLLYGWGALDLAFSFWFLLRRERERDALLLRMEARLDHAATLEREIKEAQQQKQQQKQHPARPGDKDDADEAVLWSVEDAAAATTTSASPALPPVAATGRRAQPPLLIPAGKALLAERLALQRDLARLEELSEEIVRREARGMHQGALDMTLDAELLASFRAQERARAREQQQRGKRGAAGAGAGAAAAPPSQASAIVEGEEEEEEDEEDEEEAEDRHQPLDLPPAAQARGRSFYPPARGHCSRSSKSVGSLDGGSAGAGAGGAGSATGSSSVLSARPLPLEALARRLISQAHEHERGARVRRVEESALKDERYLAASRSRGAAGTLGSRHSRRAFAAAAASASLRSARSVSSGPAGLALPSSFSLSPPPEDGGSSTLHVVKRTASDPLAAAPAAAAAAAAASPPSETTAAAAFDENGKTGNISSGSISITPPHPPRRPSSSCAATAAAFFARRRAGFAEWWRLLPKLEAGVIVPSFAAFLAMQIGPDLAFKSKPCSAGSIASRAAFCGVMLLATLAMEAAVFRRIRARAAAAAKEAAAAENKKEPAGTATQPIRHAHGHHEAGIVFSPCIAAATPPSGLAVGVLSGSVGASGSVAIQPITLRMGVHPQIVSATSKVATFVSATAAALSLTFAGRMNASYALAWGIVSMLLTPVGQIWADALVRSRRRPSLIVALNVARYLIGLTLVSTVILVPALDDLRRGAPDARFVMIC